VRKLIEDIVRVALKNKLSDNIFNKKIKTEK